MTNENRRTGHEGEEAATTETTPLLAASLSPIVPAGDPEAVLATPTPARAPGSDPSSGRDPDARPLPRRQILLLCYARLLEPIAFFSIFPYVNQMVRENGGLAEADMGFYSGLIESLFSLTQMVVMVAWGRAADRVGRKPVLVFSLLGIALCTSLFGFAKTIWQMVLFRCAAGVFAGSIVTVRTMISEHSTRHTQARAFSWFAVAGNLGIFVGPLIGGTLADPAGQYPAWFGGVWFFEAYPYALSSIVVGLIGISAVVVSALFIEETLHRDGKNGGSDDDDDDDEAGRSPPISTWELLRAPGVGIVLYNYGHVAMLAFAYTAVVPVFWATSVDLGGLGFAPLQISLFMGLTGFSQAVWLLVVFLRLQRRIGTNGIMRLCGTAYPFFLGSMPLYNLILRPHTDGGEAVFWTLAPIMLALGTGVSMSFTAVQLALNDVSPSHETLGTLNALALTLSSGLRSFCPALFASLFAIGARNQFLYGYFIWVVMAILGVGFTISTRLLPETSEKPSLANGADRYTDEVNREGDSDDTVR
ncbi:putative major facilitator superfamily transporter protein [Rosellinia necatrix]|uniref:Putative major facilitator superfamily transporter protein n=1 Tax=Rosellinia necatrix TaxID=77044 RepID=A0A1W2TR54_ROSNE|nr:putative major facilitator superfamily transporter protein [Rosellinia necatrix]